MSRDDDLLTPPERQMQAALGSLTPRTPALQSETVLLTVRLRTMRRSRSRWQALAAGLGATLIMSLLTLAFAVAAPRGAYRPAAYASAGDRGAHEAPRQHDNRWDDGGYREPRPDDVDTPPPAPAPVAPRAAVPAVPPMALAAVGEYLELQRDVLEHGVDALPPPPPAARPREETTCDWGAMLGGHYRLRPRNARLPLTHMLLGD